MPFAIVPITRRSVRAVLFDEADRLVAIRRTTPGQQPYYTTPGGGIESSDSSRPAALERELLEELGVQAIIGPQLMMVQSAAGDHAISVQYFHSARLLSVDESLRTGQEYTDPRRGGYKQVRIPLDQLADYELKPTIVHDFLIANAPAILADLPPAY